MRVLVVTPWFPSENAPGSGVFNLRDVELLAQDHDVSVLHLINPALRESDRHGEWETAPWGKIRQLPFSTGRAGTLWAAVRAIRTVAADVDIIHSMAFPALFPLVIANSRLPWVHTEHWSGLVNEPSTIRARLGRVVFRPGLRRPDVLVAVGQILAEAVSGYRDEAVRVIGNRVRLAKSGHAPVAAWGRAGLLRLVGVGGLMPWKGPIEAIAAVAELRKRGIEASLEWAGVGPLEGEARRVAAELGVEDRITLLGHVDPEALPDVLLRAHMFVLPTAGETFGVAIAEALGHGLPIITSGVGGHLDFLPSAATRVVTSRSAEELANAIQDLATDPDRWPAERILNYAKDTFSEATRRDGYLEVYMQAVQRATERKLAASRRALLLPNGAKRLR